MAKAKTTTKSAAKPTAKKVEKKEVKPAAKKTTKPAPKAAVKEKAKAPAKTPVKAAPKVAAKPAPKAAKKAPAKAAPKAPAKTSAKAAPKATQKTAAKPAAKPAVKAPAKAPAKTAPKTAPKPVQKPAPKKPSKPTVKPAPKGPKTLAKPPIKTPTKPAPKPPVKKPVNFAVNEHVVYPIQGVGEIQAIEKRPFRDKVVLYYVIYFETPDMTVMVPVENAEIIGLRKIVSSKEALKALELLNKEYEQANTDWKTRNQQNLELLKKGTINDIAQVVKTLYDRSTSKELPIQERKLFDNASKLLIDEVSLALKKSKKDSETMIFEKLELNRKAAPEPEKDPEDLDLDTE